MSYIDMEVAPLLAWVRILAICAGLLLLETLVILVVGWLRKTFWQFYIFALIPLFVCVCAVIGALHTHDAYLYCQQLLLDDTGHSSLAEDRNVALIVANSLHTAAVFGWLAVSVTTMLLVAGILGLIRLLLRRQEHVEPTEPTATVAVSS